LFFHFEIESSYERVYLLSIQNAEVRIRAFVARIAVPENVQNRLGKMATNGEGF
jgi:hypothetical protein